MSMTRKDFKAIADIVRSYNTVNKVAHNFDDLEFYNFVTDMASYFKKANPTFDRGKFLRAAGWYQE